jgi:LysR family transcriptional regulator, nitrogen assimilation regulatory protein
MDVRQLRYFLEIVDLKSYHRASESLRVAQPALSNQIAKLETELEVKLFVRHSRGIELTVPGAILADHARKIVGQIEDAKQAAREGGHVVVGRLAIGMPPSVGFAFAPAVIERFLADFPRVHLTVIPGFNGFLQEWLNENRIQLAIIYDPSPNSRLEKEILFDEPLVFVAPADDDKIWSTLNAPEDLAGKPLILPSRPHGVRLIIDEMAAARKVPLFVKIEIDALQLIRDLVLRRVGYTILPRSAVESDVKARVLSAREIPGLSLKRTLVLARSPRTPLGLPGERFADYLREMAALVRSGQMLGQLAI